jgi:hypothetical protein
MSCSRNTRRWKEKAPRFLASTVDTVRSVRKLQKVGVWACGRVGVWACGRVGVSAYRRIGAGFKGEGGCLFERCRRIEFRDRLEAYPTLLSEGSRGWVSPRVNLQRFKISSVSSVSSVRCSPFSARSTKRPPTLKNPRRSPRLNPYGIEKNLDSSGRRRWHAGG